MSNKGTESGVKEMWEYKVELAKYIRYLSDNGMNESKIDNHITEVKLDTLRDYFHFKKCVAYCQKTGFKF